MIGVWYEDIYVADYSPHLRDDYDGARGANKDITHQVKRTYWESLTPLAEYLSKSISYEVPEVICFSPIPLKQIRVVETTNSELVINRIREKGGFSPHPLRPKPDTEVQARVFGELPGLDKPKV
ncbi:MAG: hypothetical protein P4M13_04640 [Alphaproteobacteria bacterium]|nr:hypothetical protein [Alphaproteobacteria bacterium]